MRAWAWWLWLVCAMARARELDPAACASRFDVQRDKIIRTEESREMGARYLSELDVGARHECLRLCCETDACDVFVYEEKSPGSCYLFNCGPPEDFRCKFTAHSNFSSGVLALSRRLAELQDQERLAHHEQELANLRSVTSTTLRTTTTAATPPPTQPPRAPQPREPPQPPPPRCSRYQFECHTGGECIAVYNACDGVPQCADGSDEAPELGCPPARPPPALPPTQPPTTTTLQPKPVMQESSELGAMSGEGALGDGVALGGERWPHRLTQAQSQHRFSAYVSPLVDGDGVAPGVKRWPHHLMQAQSQHRFNIADPGPSSHIFSHKGGLLQEPEAGALAPYPAFEAPWPRRPWPQQTGMESMSGERGWGGAGGGYGRLDWSEPDPRRAWPVPQPRPEPELSMYMPAKTMPEMPMVYSSQQQTLRDSPKKGFDLTSKKQLPEAVTEAPPPPPQSRSQPEQNKPSEVDNTTKKKDIKQESPALHKAATVAVVANKKTAAAASLLATHDHLATDTHDGLSERPPAAVLLLVLGVLMTTVMGVMVGCRARAARRRLRRGKSPFAHDADYLVNGMYL